MLGELLPDTLYMCYNSVMKKISARKSILIAVLILVAVTLVAVSACNDKDSVSFSLREVTVYLSDGENMVLTYTPSVKTGSGNGEYTLSVANPTLAKVSADGKRHYKKVIFDGIVILLSMNKNFSGQTIVLKDRGLFNAFNKTGGLQKIALEAAKQSGRGISAAKREKALQREGILL